jgi:hypothetical protein
MTRKWLVAVVSVVTFSLPATAAFAAAPLPASSYSPDDGASFPPQSSITFTASEAPAGLQLWLEVSTQPTLSATNGTLANEYTVSPRYPDSTGGGWPMQESDATPGNYSATVCYGSNGTSGYYACPSTWTGYQGTYYWQVHGGKGDAFQYTGPVRSLTIAPPPSTAPAQPEPVEDHSAACADYRNRYVAALHALSRAKHRHQRARVVRLRRQTRRLRRMVLRYCY